MDKGLSFSKPPASPRSHERFPFGIRAYLTSFRPAATSANSPTVEDARRKILTSAALRGDAEHHTGIGGPKRNSVRGSTIAGGRDVKRSRFSSAKV
jgi:hypothetical protein